MSQTKTERIMNLMICLLVARRFLPKDQIRESVVGYQDRTDAAFERTFERDKDELRSLGVPIVAGPCPDSDQVGYRIFRDAYELQPVQFSAAESIAVGAAAQVWQQASVGEATKNALLKLKSAGIEPDAGMLVGLTTRVSGDPGFDTWWTAVIERREVSFSYRGRDATRHLQPWRLVLRRGSWYVVGFDLDKQDRRVFKLTRVTGAPKLGEETDAFTPPDDPDSLRVDVAQLCDPEVVTVLLALPHGQGHNLRRGAKHAPEAQHDYPQISGCDFVKIDFVSSEAALAAIAADAPQAFVLEPVELRQALINQMHQVIAAYGRSES